MHTYQRPWTDDQPVDELSDMTENRFCGVAGSSAGPSQIPY